MKTYIYLGAAVLLATTLAGLYKVFAAGESRTSSSASPRPELEY